MKIAIEGCAHGELEKIYDTIESIEKNENIQIDLLICCGDFQSTRNLEDLRCMAVPPKYYNICTFYKYYSGEKVAPCLTIFIGGNHEASNYLQELAFGGWVAPNIYYLGYAGVVNVGGIRIGGISGIYKSNDYFKGRHEISPYSESTKRSIYHIRNLDVFRLKQLAQPVDIFLSHDWPRGVHKYGNEKKLLKNKPFFQKDIEEDQLGSEPAAELLHHLKPNYWFSAHLHTKFPALVRHNGDDEKVDVKVTKFLALDKCLPKRKFLQIIDVPKNDDDASLKYDLEWLTVLYLTNHLTSVKYNAQYMPGPGTEGRWIFTPTEDEMNDVSEKFQNDLTIPNNFSKTAPAYDPTLREEKNLTQPPGQTNPQTTLFCEKLGIDDPTHSIIKLKNLTDPSLNLSVSTDSFIFIPASVERQKKFNMSLPETKTEENQTPKSIKLNLTLPAPKNELADIIRDDTLNSFNDSEINTSELNSTTIFSNDSLSTSTPQKKFKRRNESIYKTLE